MVVITVAGAFGLVCTTKKEISEKIIPLPSSPPPLFTHVSKTPHTPQFLLLGTLYSTESGSFASSSAYSSLTSKNTPFLTSTARFAIEDAQSRFNDATTGLSEFETVPWDKKITMVLVGIEKFRNSSAFSWGL